MAKKAAIIGATSGIGRALAVELHSRGYIVGATGRRTERLEEINSQLNDRIHTVYMDVTDLDEAKKQFDRLIKIMGGCDIIVLNAGISSSQVSSGENIDVQVVDVNVRGFANLAGYSFQQFEQQGSGHIVGISSIAGLFGWGLSVSYNASKAFVNTYLQGYRQKANHSDADITVTTILPGFVESEMTEDRDNLFWVASKEKATRQIADAIEQKKNEVYVTKRWRLVGWAIKLVPNWMWNRM